MPDRFEPLFPGYDVLAKWDSPSWNDATRQAVAKRLRQVPPRRFFREEEWRLLESISSRILPQPERARPIPIVPWIDSGLHSGQGGGTRYADLPPDREAWRQGLAAIADETRRRHDGEFELLDEERQDEVLRLVQRGEIRSPLWAGLPPARFFTDMLVDAIVGTYYSHPDAWSEIGFGGPASPRGYVRLTPNRTDPWEARRR